MWTTMKSYEMQLHSKANLALFCIFIPLILGSNSVKDISVTTILKEIKFERALGELESKKMLLSPV